MKQVLKKIAYPLIILIVAASCSLPRYASAQNDGYYDDHGNYNNNDNSYNNQDNNNYNNDQNNGYNNNNDYYNNPNNYDEEPSEVNINMFTNALSPYGSWIMSPVYGQVWVPAYHGFVPYSTGGHWVYSGYGWTWASVYSWGWAPFHYGRWVYNPLYGWMWVPGYVWGPAWVAWRSGGGYYGWSPLGPGMAIGVNIGFGIPYNQWVFLPYRYMGYPTINRYYVPPVNNVTIIHNTTIINNTTVYNNRSFVAGPSRAEVERFTGRTVNAVSIQNAVRPGATVVNNNTVQMYRPGVKARAQQQVQNSPQLNTNRNDQQVQRQFNRMNDNLAQDNVQQNTIQRNNGQQYNQQNNMPVPDQRDRININRPQRMNNDFQNNVQQYDVQRNNQQHNNQQNNPPQQQYRMRNDQPRQQQMNEGRDRNDQYQQQQRMQNNNFERRQEMSNQFNNRKPDFNQQQRQQPVYRQPGNGGGRNRR
jgi:hypothetical protein